MKISVIIAVYNTERYLSECLDSLMRQTHQDWEAFCVDDCSTDSSLSILNDFAKKDSRFNVIRMDKNGGQAKARNRAIMQSTGDIIAFLDSDDWLSDDALERMNETFVNYPDTDSVLWDCQFVYPDHTEGYQMEPFEVMDGKEAFVKSLSWKIHGVYATTAKIHKAVLYDESSKWYSDDNTTRIHYLNSRKVRTCSGKYFYRQHKESVTHTVNIHHFDIFDANDSMLRQLREHNTEEKLVRLYENQRWLNIIGCYLYYFVYRSQFNDDERKDILGRMKTAYHYTNFNHIEKKHSLKFGYGTMFGNWTLFRLQEELYFGLRKLLGRNVIQMILLLFIFLSTTLNIQAQNMGKMSRFVRQATLSYTKKYTVEKKSANGKKGISPALTALVKTDKEDDSVFESSGGRCYAHWGNIHIATIPLRNISSFSNLPEVKRIEAKEPCSIDVDTVRFITRSFDIIGNMDWPIYFSGKGIVIGVQDIGFDLTHTTYKDWGTYRCRISKFWDMLDNEGFDPEAEDGLIVGKEFIGETEILAKAHSYDGKEETHGTHTSGIAAGSGQEKKATMGFMGTAPSADIVLVANAVTSNFHLVPEELQYRYTSATDLLGFKYIFDYADSIGQPCVISFSEGSHEDLYGDCQLMYEVLEQMTGPGRIIVASAGNEGIKLTYLHKPKGKEEISSAITGKNAYFTLRGENHFSFTLDFRGGTEPEKLTINTQDIIQMPDSMLVDTIQMAGKEYYLNIASYPSCYNEKEIATELLLQRADGSDVGQGPYYVILTLLGENQDVEAFASGGQFYHSSKLPQYHNAESSHNIHFPSSAPSVICVGNSAWRRGIKNYLGEWKAYDCGSDGVRNISSSTGPTMMGLTKPDVMAPGTNVTSSYNSFYLENNPDAPDVQWDRRRFVNDGRLYSWNCNSGTSMSAPVVAGIIAMWLEAKPDMTPAEVLEVIRATSRHYDDSLTYPNNEYGNGDIDAYAGAVYIMNLTGKIDGFSTHNPKELQIRPKGKSISVSSESILNEDVTLFIYNIEGELQETEHLSRGQSAYLIDTNLQDGLYAVQCKSRSKAYYGSQIIRIGK